MKYAKRNDGRKFNETRPITAEVGVIKNAVGSAKFQIGKTIAIAAVYGPNNVFPKFLQKPDRAILRCNYNMMAFSGSGDRVRPGTNRRGKEIGMVIEKAFENILDLSEFPKAAIDVFIELPQTDAGTRCAGICAASLALADAGFEMKDLVCAISCGLVGDQVVADLDYSEEAFEGGSVDIPIAMTPRNGEITLLQLDGEISKEDLKKAVEFGKEACLKIYEIQKQVLKAKYEETKQ
ncbi:exosome complex exonuclease Rrp41 [Candidatus Woesearchaeota archaeon]|nr:exosome complex exonuclease Rrp41 [Candidatus Woesearchaeota archaeon]